MKLRSVLTVVVCSAATALVWGDATQAAVVCTGPGVPVGCVVVAPVVVPGGPAVVPGGPVLNPTPGVGYGPRGVGVRPAAGPGVGPNVGGPVNRPGRR
ncbi:hypothetical protein [Cyanobium sp. WAJ14-Wanaka]|uniref:hypothetical protein n=1 Tax=Cyanobium sp. WAJ14-Wanaka TaxID=2823725 RepID=UPI0020CF21A2|nr:hypothetical protein [Cyanobium sp. WAJ14-Wanaka]MCP9775464.1 hypothetical protein [Cyanobium sp. WAJ14-Wanaka]